MEPMSPLQRATFALALILLAAAFVYSPIAVLPYLGTMLLVFLAPGLAKWSFAAATVVCLAVGIATSFHDAFLWAVGAAALIAISLLYARSIPEPVTLR